MVIGELINWLFDFAQDGQKNFIFGRFILTFV